MKLFSLHGEALDSLDGEAYGLFTPSVAMDRNYMLLNIPISLPFFFAASFFVNIYFIFDPSLLSRVSPILLLCFRSEGSFVNLRNPRSHHFIASMEDLSDLLASNARLTSKENSDIDVGGGEEETEATRDTYDVVGRVVSAKTYSAHTLQSNIERLLRSVKGFQLESLGDNRFMLRFNHPLDRTHALEGCSWLLEQCAMLLFPLFPQGPTRRR